VSGAPLVGKAGGKVTFELLEVPGAKPHLRSSFAAKDMVVNGQIVY
jgi:hypothetical protein